MIHIPQPAIGNAEQISSDVGPLWFRADDHIMRPIVQQTKLWEPGETALLRSLMKPSFRVLDVGAHIGYFSVVAHCAAPGVTIDAIEPDPFSSRLCELNLFNAGANSRVWTCGLGDSRNSFAFTISEKNPGDSRVLANNEKAKIVVPVLTADELFPDTEFDIIKVDVQGFESRVLLGMRELLTRNPSTKLLVEFFPKSIIENGETPINILYQYHSLGFRIITLVGEQLRENSFDEIISMCSNSGPEGFVTLLLYRN